MLFWRLTPSSMSLAHVDSQMMTGPRRGIGLASVVPRLSAKFLLTMSLTRHGHDAPPTAAVEPASTSISAGL
jgi:hypothetical protein